MCNFSSSISSCLTQRFSSKSSRDKNNSSVLDMAIAYSYYKHFKAVKEKPSYIQSLKHGHSIKYQETANDDIW